MKLYVLGDPNGIRTRAAAVKGRCPRPLNDGASGAVFCDCRKPSIRVIPNEGKTLIQQSLRTNSRSWCPHASEIPTSTGHSRSEFNCCPHAWEVPKLWPPPPESRSCCPHASEVPPRMSTRR